MSKAQLLWAEAFNDCIGEEQEKSGVNPLDWRASGRVSKAYPDKENGDWWAEQGPIMVQNFIEFWESSGWQVWTTPEGIPGIEIQFNVMYGDVRIKAFADMIAVTPTGELAVVDFKSGASMPGSDMQLGLYATAMEKQFGIRPSAGYYYDARKVMMIPAQKLDIWTAPLFTELFKQFEESVQRQVFLPNTNNYCSSCSVKDYCYIQGGEFAHLMDPLYAIAQQKETNV
jgi:RecB family exonuclease